MMTMKNLFPFALVFLLAGCLAAPVPVILPTAALAAGPVLTYSREGGFVGYCDELEVYADGRAAVSDCRGFSGEVWLSGSQRERLEAWLGQYAAFEQARSDGAVADGMTIRLRFAGQGSQAYTEAFLGQLDGLAGEVISQGGASLPPGALAAREALLEFFLALRAGDYVLAAKRYGGPVNTLAAWNPDIRDDLPLWLERACTQNGLQCLEARRVVYVGLDDAGNQRFVVEFSNPDGSLFEQGPCCGSEEGPVVSAFPYTMKYIEPNWLVLELPPYMP
jgi:hypothetical protein